MRRAVKIEGRKSLKRVKKPLLAAAMKQKRLERSNRLLTDLQNHGNRIVIFSDEKTFTVDPVVNKRNDRIVVAYKDNIVTKTLPCVRKITRTGLSAEALLLIIRLFVH